MRQTLRVDAVSGDQVRLEATRAPACARCGARSGCGAAAFSDMAGGEALELRAPPGGSLRAGDEVVVTCPAATFLGAAALGYLAPATALAAAAGFGAAAGWSDLATALLCLPALALSFLPLLRAERTGRLRAALRIEAPETGA
ncbi:MAG: SoxR reducing system RseC family protein [Rubrimonas sp.]